MHRQGASNSDTLLLATGQVRRVLRLDARLQANYAPAGPPLGKLAAGRRAAPTASQVAISRRFIEMSPWPSGALTGQPHGASGGQRCALTPFQ
jgi:hypothetical protein